MYGFAESLSMAASGMRAQGERLKVISENIANADSTGETPNDLPYRRKVVTFKNELNRQTGISEVRVGKVDVDKSDFVREYMPGHPAADADGYVLKPNVNTLVEVNDMREAERSYQADMSVIETTRQMLMSTVGLLRA